MKTRFLCTAIAALALPLLSSAAFAGPIERACLRSDRDAANRALCACIQQAADQTLRSGDQRKAAVFFRDPDRAHETWMSKRASDDAFWERYKQFGATAEAYCS
jgi:hypothetical protein